MPDEIPIREYEQAVYVYWFGPSLPAVKIGHSNDPDKRLAQLGNDTAVPDHLAAFAAIVWVDRKREKIEALAHQLAADFRRSGEWFELTASEALEYIIEAARQLGVRFEVEDRAGVYGNPPNTFKEAEQLYQEVRDKVKGAKNALSDAENNFENLYSEDDISERNRLSEAVNFAKEKLDRLSFHEKRVKRLYLEKLEEYKTTPEYAEEQKAERLRIQLATENKRIQDLLFQEKSVAYWKNKWKKDATENQMASNSNHTGWKYDAQKKVLWNENTKETFFSSSALGFSLSKDHFIIYNKLKPQTIPINQVAVAKFKN